MSTTTAPPIHFGTRGDNIEYEHSHNLIDLLGHGLPDDHHLREFYINGEDAGATRIHFGPEWQCAERKGIFRLCITDDGCGMCNPELKEFFLSFGKGKSKHGINEHYHIGARISSGLWNAYGLFIVSLKDGEEWGMWIRRDENGYYPVLFTYVNDAGRSVTSEVWPTDIFSDEEIESLGFDPSQVLPNWVHEAGHGTAFIFLGETGTEHTFAGRGVA